jgi:antirestriction protein ArdC
MTFKQARELKANVRTGEHGSLVVYADKILRTESRSKKIGFRSIGLSV